MRVYVVLEYLSVYALNVGQNMRDVTHGVFLTKEKAFRAAERQARLLGQRETIRVNGKYLSCPNEAILFEIVACEILE